MKYLEDINLDKNKIKKLSENIFNGLTKFLSLENNELETFIHLKSFEKLNLKSNPIKTIDSFNSNISFLSFSMENISIENIKILKELLSNPKVVKTVGNILRYYSPIHIENRNDTNCLKVLFFIRNKILYNFLNEHIDSLSFIQNCFNISKEEFKNFYNNEIN